MHHVRECGSNCLQKSSSPTGQAVDEKEAGRGRITWFCRNPACAVTPSAMQSWDELQNETSPFRRKQQKPSCQHHPYAGQVHAVSNLGKVKRQVTNQQGKNTILDQATQAQRAELEMTSALKGLHPRIFATSSATGMP